MSMMPQNFSTSEPQRLGQPSQAPSPYFASGGAPNSPNAQQQQGIDFVGPVLRRKLLVVLLGIFGAAIGYFAYTRATPMFQSSTQLMITNQAPPEIVNGEKVVQRISIPKYQRLITSQLIVERATQQKELQKLPMFAKVVPDLVPSTIQEAVDVKAAETEQSILLTVEGEFPEDLPIILNAIIDAFSSELREDSQDNSRDSVELIAKMRDQLKEEKDKSEREYFAILQRLNIPNLEKGDELINPYTSRMEQLSVSRSELSTQLRDLSNRLDLALQRQASDEEGVVTALAAEARKYLGFEIHHDSSVVSNNGVADHQLPVLRQKIAAIEKSIGTLEIRKNSAMNRYGVNHPVIQNLNDLIALEKTELNEISNLVSEAIDSTDISDPASEISVKEQVVSRNRQWIDVYLASLTAERERLKLTLGQVDTEFVEIEEKAQGIAGDVLSLRMLKSQIAEKQQEVEEVIQRLSEIDLVSNNFVDTKVRVINSAGIGRKIAPSFLQYIGGGLAIGCLLGIGLAVLIDRSDMTFRNPGEIFERLKVPVVCKVPPIKNPKKLRSGTGSPALITLHKPTSTAAEAIRSARTALFFHAQQEGGTSGKVYLLTSPSPGDGKSTVCANLAISLAQAGKSTILIDADFRRPRVHTYFGDAIEPGVLQAIAGTMELEECLRRDQVENLARMTAGGRPKNPGEVVNSREFASLLETLRERFDYVLIDSPPLLPVNDAAAISSLVDGVFMVLRIRKGVVVTASKAKENLDMVSANLLGVIVNGVDDNPHYNEYGSYGYGYGYGYGYSYGNGKYYESRNSRYQEKIGSSE